MSTKRPARAAESNIDSNLRLARTSNSKTLRLSSSNLTAVPEEVFTLSSLEYILLDNNGLQEVPERLWDLPHLRHVCLVGNPLEVLPKRPGLSIDGSIYLRCRDQIDINNIVELTIGLDVAPDDETFWITELRRRRGPTSLRIGKWNLTIGASPAAPERAILNLLDSLGDLDFLEGLSLRGFSIPRIPDGIRALRRLNYLDVSGLGLTVLPDWIGEMNLLSLTAIDNELTSLPPSVRNLRTLSRLALDFNPLKAIPDGVFQLTALESLGLRTCGITDVPEDILSLEILSDLRLDDNDVESPPAEVASKGLDAIRDYWRQRADTGVDYLCEAKLIILGEPGAGKTSLARKIEDPDYRLRANEKSTEGIDVIRYQFPTAIHTREGGEEKLIARQFRANIWDFGGQEIYHATHQFFLTRRSLYVLVCDDRKEDTDFSYWLHVVEMLTDGSPLLVVQNEKQDRKRDLNLSNLRARFTNLRDTLSTNLETNRGLDHVVQSIRQQLEALPHVGAGLPASWKTVRDTLERDQRDYIGLDEYLAICERHRFERREDKLQLSGYLHDLGICLHFQDDPLLKNTIVLKPAWGTDAVYRVLDDPDVIAAHGRFTRGQLGRIWSEAKYTGMHDELLQLMMKFQLCYALEGERAYMAPQLLSSEQPGYPWDPTEGLVVRYEYTFMPKGILTRFIVAMNHLIGADGLVWKTG